MAQAVGEAPETGLRLAFDRRLKLEFHGSQITSDGGLFPFRELDDALGLSAMAGEVLTDPRTGANGRHSLVGQFRQSVFGRLAGYDDINDADRLAHDPAMRWVVGGAAVTGQAASTSQMGRFETEVMTLETNLAALADLSGQWIGRVHARRPVKTIVLDIDSSVSPTHGKQQGTAYNGHFHCTCYHPLFVFNQFGDLERCALRSGNVHSADSWRAVLEPVVARYRDTVKPRRVVAKVEWHPGELYPRVGFLVTNLCRSSERVVAFYNGRGTAEQWIKEGKNAVKWTRLSCQSMKANAVRLQLHALAYNLANFLRTLALPDSVERWSLTSLREKVVKIGAKVIAHARYTIFQMAEVAVPQDLFRRILQMIDALRPPIIRC